MKRTSDTRTTGYWVSHSQQKILLNRPSKFLNATKSLFFNQKETQMSMNLKKNVNICACSTDNPVFVRLLKIANLFK